MTNCKMIDFSFDYDGEEVIEKNAGYRLGMREPAMLMPREKLSRMGVEYYSDAPEMPVAPVQKTEQTVVSTPAATTTQKTEQKPAEGKARQNLIYVIAAAVVGYFAYNQME